MTTAIETARATAARLHRALYDIEAAALPAQLDALFAPDAPIHLPFPFRRLEGAAALFESAYAPLLRALPDLERRPFISMAGVQGDAVWVGCAGHYMGVFESPWLDIPPTQHLAYMRFHEFFRIAEDGRIVEMQALWDIPELMMQAGAWAMTPSLGVTGFTPPPATSDGIRQGARDDAESAASLKLVGDMLTGLSRSPHGVEAMELPRFWHPKMNWYGPAGIGAMRRISGFRNWHQIPFLNALPDRGGIPNVGAFFADDAYVGFTAFPGMRATVTGGGWLGIAPANQAITLRSLDFWRCEAGLIRENWVLVDLLDVYDQLKIDVFARMREFTFARRHASTQGLQK